MSNPEKGNVAEDAAHVPPRIDKKIDDPPPPYTPYKSISEPKPPPLPSAPPAIIRDPLPATTPQMTHSPKTRMADYTAYQAWQDCKAGCSTAFSWSRMICVNCVDGCLNLCIRRKSRQNQ